MPVGDRAVPKCPPTCLKQLLDAPGQGKPLARKHWHPCCKPMLGGSQGQSPHPGRCLSSGVLVRAPLWGCCPSCPPITSWLSSPPRGTRQLHAAATWWSASPFHPCPRSTAPRRRWWHLGEVLGEGSVGMAPTLAGYFPLPGVLPSHSHVPTLRAMHPPNPCRGDLPFLSGSLRQGSLCGTASPVT